MAANLIVLRSDFPPKDTISEQFEINPDHITKKRWRSTSSYRSWQFSVVYRDRECKCCGEKDHLHAHHIRHATYWPELRFTISNGITLCAKCHSLFHNDLIGNTRKKCDEKQLADFFKIRGYYVGLAVDLAFLPEYRTLPHSSS